MSNVLSSQFKMELLQSNDSAPNRALKQGQSTQAQPKLDRRKERLWTTVLFVTIATLPALLGGCTLGFSSIALLDLSELEKRPDYKLSKALFNIFAVRPMIYDSVHQRDLFLG